MDLRAHDSGDDSGDSGQRIARHLAGEDYDRADGSCRAAPEWLVLVINNFCNLRCRMCDVGVREEASVFYAHLVGHDRRNMSPHLLDAILDQAGAFSPRPKVGLAYTEPLLHPEIVTFSRAIVERGFFCSITTNGYLLPRLAEPLVEAGVHEITVSIDGPREVHDRVRGREGSFERLYAGIERLNGARARSGRDRPVVRFSYTLTDENYTRLVDFVRETEALRPADFTFSHLNFISSEMAAAHNARVDGELMVSRSNLGTMDLSQIDLEAMWQSLEAVKAFARARGDFPALKIVPDLPSPAALAVYYREPLRFVGGRRCKDPWHMLMIRTDGTVIPAHGRCYNVPVGNVLEQPLEDLWNNGRFRAFRQTLRSAGGTLPACARCCGVIGKPPEVIGKPPEKDGVAQ